MGGFVWGAFTGKHLMRWGPRASCVLGACTLGGGFAIASVALSTANLPLLYVGGAVWGMSLSLAYVPPVATLLQWFPDRKGFASGGCILGFGLGSALAVPFFGSLLRHFRRAPERLGALNEVQLVNENGRLFAGGREVIVATLADVRSWGIEEGVYVVGTGTTGLPQTFAVLSVTYFTLMALSAFVYRLPAGGTFVPPPAVATPPIVTTGAAVAAAPAAPLVLNMPSVNAEVAIRTPQFWIAYASFGLSICGAYAFLATGKTMMADSFGVLMPDVVTASFMATFVALMGGANLGGRVVWPALSDVLARRIVPAEPFWGRRLTFSLMWGIGPPLYMLIVWSVHSCAAGNTTILPLITYVFGVCGVLAAFGGTAATRPALAADIFGNKHVGIITAQQLSVVMPAAFAGPWIANYFREKSLRSSATELAALVDPVRFKQAFGATLDELPALLDAKTVTIVRLMELVPAGTVDPTPFVYDTTLYVVAAMQATAFCTNQLLKPVPPSKYAREDVAKTEK
jgi:MFS family permease